VGARIRANHLNRACVRRFAVGVGTGSSRSSKIPPGIRSVLGFDVEGELVGPGSQDVSGVLVQGVVSSVFLQEPLVSGVGAAGPITRPQRDASREWGASGRWQCGTRKSWSPRNIFASASS
jgi:hypothetical protein